MTILNHVLTELFKAQFI